MASNEFAKPKTEAPAAKPAPTQPKTTGLRAFLDLFGIIEKERVISMMPYVFFLTCLAFIYISNSYYAENTIRQIDHLNNELKELRYEYISIKSELMFKCKQSAIAEKLKPFGINESTTPPQKIVVK